ncbi:MAG: NUDIX domain-containing protein [Bacteroidetes bacterium]|nr:NUDIX domain-containing protein [Bacteroidota bacterium]
MESAGIILYKEALEGLQVLLGHMGGPYWARKHAGAWTIPKGEVRPGEDAFAAALREFTEEMGFTPEGPFLPLAPIVQRSGKRVHVWAAKGEADPAALRSNTFSIEWPPRSGRQQRFAEIDRAAWYPISEAARLVVHGQEAALHELERRRGKA